MTSDASLSQSLEDVRDAYRLVWAYQRRCLDSVRLLAELFPDRVFYHWSNFMCGQPPMRGTSPFDRWTLDFLPVYCTSFLYLGSGGNSPRPGDWMLEVKLWTDTECGALVDSGTEPDLGNLPPAQVSKSEISLIAWKCLEPLEGQNNWLHNVWDIGHWARAESAEIDVPFAALDGFEAFRVDESIANLGTRSDLERFAGRAKAKFHSVLGIDL